MQLYGCQDLSPAAVARDDIPAGAANRGDACTALLLKGCLPLMGCLMTVTLNTNSYPTETQLAAPGPNPDSWGFGDPNQIGICNTHVLHHCFLQILEP